MKVCNKCKVAQHISNFSKAGYGNKRRNTCKTCQAKYRANYYSKNKDRENSSSKKYKKLNAGKINAINMNRHRKKVASRAILTSRHKLQIEAIYKRCSEYRKMGLDFEVDHIIPLQGKTVSGLHVPWNLRITTAKFNRSKRNKYESGA